MMDYEIVIGLEVHTQLKTVSKLQTTLYKYLDDLNINYVKEHCVGPWVFDCYIPLHKLLIECQGDYWHNQPKAIRNDKAKATPIVPPMVAIALVRCSSRVRSASNAVTTADTAPAP